MKRKNIYTFILMLLCCTIYVKTKAQTYGVEQNSNGSYTVYMNGGSVTTNTMGQYTSPSYQYDMSTGDRYWDAGQGSMCIGCYGVPVISTTTNVYYSPTYNYQALAGTPPTTYSNTGVIGQYQMYYNSSGAIIAQIPFAVNNSGTSSYSYISGYSEGCPSCAAISAVQAAGTQWNNSSIALFNAQSAALRQQILANLQAQITVAYNQQNDYNYYYYFYSVGYLTGSLGTPNPPIDTAYSTHNPTPPSSYPRPDTTKPTARTADSVSRAGGNELTKIMDSIKTKPRMKLLLDSLSTSTFERSVTIYDSSGFYNEYKTADSTMPSSSMSKLVGYDVTVGPNHKNISSWVHSHTTNAGADALPDCVDLYNLMRIRSVVVPAGVGSLKNSFIPTSDAKLAVTVSSDSLMGVFLAQYPKDSAIIFTDTVRMLNPTPPHDSLKVPIEPAWSTFKAAGDSLSMQQEFNDAGKAVEVAKYPFELEQTYAQVYMFARYNMGLKMYIEVNGIYKELTCTYYRDTDFRKTLHITIYINN